MTEDMLEDVKEEDVAGKIAWYKQRVLEAKDAFIRCLEELGYAVEVREAPVTITEGLSGPYESLEYLITLHGKDELEGAKLRLSPKGVWWLGTQGMIMLYGNVGEEYIGYFRADGLFSRDHKDPHYGGIMEDGWYWDDQGLDTRAEKLSRDTVAELLEQVS
jgi:hypothetical protein